MVSHWAFDEDAGAAVTVASDTHYNATPSNGVTFGSAGVFGNAVHFDGTTSNNLSLNKVNSMYDGDFTYATWVNMEVLADGAQFFGDWSNPWAFRFFYSNTGSNFGYASHIRSDVGTTDIFNLAGDSAWTANQWYHVATVYDDANGIAYNYVNGTLVNSRTFTANANRRDNSADDSRMHHFGWKQDNNTTQHLTGYLDETYIYDNPLSAAEVRNLMRYNNLAGPVVSDTRYSANSIPVEGLFSSLVGQSLNEAVATYTVGAKASPINLGVSRMIGGINGLSFTGTQDVTGAGSAFNLENLGVSTGGYSSGVQNSMLENVALRLTVGSATLTSGIGMHANALVTLDIAEIRAAGAIGADEIMHFTSYAGVNTNNGNATVNAAVILWDENNVPLTGYVNGSQYSIIETASGSGVYKFDETQAPGGAFNQYLTYASGPALYDLTLPENARYMTLVAAEGNGAKSNDHAIFAGAKLSLEMPNSIYLNQLFGQGAAPERLNYAHALNTGVAPAPGTDLGIVKAQTNWDTQLDLLGDASGVVFDTSRLAIGNAAGNLLVKSNMCGYDTVTNFMTAGKVDAAIGLHANGMMTFDLDALRDYNGWGDSVLQFSTTADLATCGGTPSAADIYSLVLLFDETNVLSAYLQGVEVDIKNDGGVWSLADSVDLSDFDLITTTDGTEVEIDFNIANEAKYMTLMLLAGASSNSDHGLYLNPMLTASSANSVPEPATWVMMLLACGMGMFAVRRRKSVIA